MRISDWSSDVCSSDLPPAAATRRAIARRSPSVAMRARRATRLPQRVAVRIDHPHLAQAKRADAGLDLRAVTHHHPGQRTLADQARAFGVHRTQRQCAHAGGIARVIVIRQIVSLLVDQVRSEEHTSELQSLMRNSYAVFCLKNKRHNHNSRILNI